MGPLVPPEVQTLVLLMAEPKLCAHSWFGMMARLTKRSTGLIDGAAGVDTL